MRLIASITYFIVLITSEISFTQVEFAVSKSVIGSGIGIMQNQTVQIHSTLGQTLVGETANDSHIGLVGFWHAKFTSQSTSTEELNNKKERPSGFLQSYPNPASTFVVIKFALSGSSPVNITLYDLLGKRIKQLKRLKVSEGLQEMVLDLDEFQTGTYMCSITTNEFIASRMINISK